MKKALITGITGQDGSYLAEFLLKKGYEVHGIIRRSSSFNTGRIDHIYQDPHVSERNLILHYGELSDATNLIKIVQEVHPDEIYNLGAQSHVKVSFEKPEYTANSDGVGALRLLEAIKILGLEKKTKFYQASTSEMFGASAPPQNELTPFYPRSPYGVAKLYAHWITINYREAYGIFAVNGILFNHESPRRGQTFVTKKITKAAARIKHDLQDKLYIGNLDAERDWGHARDYVEAMYLMLQQDNPEDFVIASGKKYSVRYLCELAFKSVGIEIIWQGKGIDEKGFDQKTGKILIEIDQKYFRPTEVDFLLGDPAKAQEKLKWKAKISFEDLIKEMVEYDLEEVKKDVALKGLGYILKYIQG